MQEMVEYAVRSTYIQGHQALAGETNGVPDDQGTEWGCRYRTKEGYKCIVGQLIPDDMYAPEMENVVARDIFDERSSAYMLRKAIEKTIGRRLTDDDIDVLSYLQDAHDNIDSGVGADPKTFKPALAEHVEIAIQRLNENGYNIDDEFLAHLDEGET